MKNRRLIMKFNESRGSVINETMPSRVCLYDCAATTRIYKLLFVVVFLYTKNYAQPYEIFLLFPPGRSRTTQNFK